MVVDLRSFKHYQHTSYVSVTFDVSLKLIFEVSGQVSPMICSVDAVCVTICVIVILRQTLIVNEFAKANKPMTPRT